MIRLPDPINRYEAKYSLLCDEVQRLRKQNARLNSQIRDLQVKLRDSQVEEDKLRNTMGGFEQRKPRGGLRSPDLLAATKI
jgi:uncharacterized protein YlxW (UPF0749 family)